MTAPTSTAASANHPSFALSTSLFLRALALIHAIAFGSLWTQLPGLIGPHGILPANTYLAAVREHLGASAYAQLPTLAWFFGTDAFPHVLCAVGLAAAAFLFAGFVPAVCLGVLWIAYLSLVGVGQIFLGFQWDALLLETTLLALFLVPRALRLPWSGVEPSRIAHFLLTWLLVRLMLLSGAVKLASGDPAWRDFTALTFHYETQPLPNPLAWWAHQLPTSFHRASCVGMFVIEFVAPLLLFAPRTLRHNAALLLAALQIAIALTGNYTFFNLLTFVLCLLHLDDAWWRQLLHAAVLRRLPSPAVCHPIDDKHPFRLHRVLRGLALAAATAVILYTGIQMLPSLGLRARTPDWFASLSAHVAPFRSLNNYGLFAVMTTSRPELIIEGSNDAREWHAYELPYKPGALSRRPPVVAPHQPRLDWQLWFAALGAPEHNRWVLSLGEHLLRGTPDVLALFAHNPFSDRPPRYLRIVRYDYHFTTATEHARTGQWWRRTPIDYYVQPISLR